MVDPRDQNWSPTAAFDLTGRVAVVTGAGSGIGAAAAEHLAGAGAAVVLADLDEGALGRVAKAIEGRGAQATIVATDVSRQAEVDALVDLAVSTYGRLDVMANVAGIPGDGLVRDITEDRFDQVMAVNVKGVLFGCQAAMRVMAEQGSGSIVNVASAAIDCAVANAALYAMTKAAVVMLTMDLAVEAGPSGVRVNAIAPGPTLTAFTTRHLVNDRGERDEAQYDQRVAAMAAMSPLGLVGEADDQALQILYLASDAARYVTGSIMRANGGVGIVW
ncbi:MAG: dehydrogenase, short-chain alcohol dehydrogenase like [Acidimicrobiales bacterium]|nr:dehydrogenase, short-chain alcohol dehydrogenase like [Acidimicrobiales bacterium]